jgi:hypothetical protein
MADDLRVFPDRGKGAHKARMLALVEPHRRRDDS